MADDSHVLVTLTLVKDETRQCHQSISRSALFVSRDLPTLEVTTQSLPTDYRGITFGKKPRCGVELPFHPLIDGVQFALVFDSQSRLTIFNHRTKNLVQVSYNGQDTGARTSSVWVLNDPNMSDTLSEMEICVSRLITFRVSVHRISLDDSWYKAFVDRFNKAREQKSPLHHHLARLALDGTQLQMGGQLGDSWLRCQSSGSRTSSVVDLYWNPHDGSRKVIKTPLIHNNNRREIEVKNARWAKEAKYLAKMRNHHHAVNLLDFRQPAELHLEFVPGGTLAMANTVRRFTNRDVAMILYQSLAVLRFMHAKNPPLVHGDVKPDNILVNRRTNESICVKIADFGETGAQTLETTMAGDTVYGPPEVMTEGGFAPPFDIWSMGMTALFFVNFEYFEMWQRVWSTLTPEAFCAEVRSSADMFVRFLGRHMLIVDPARRSTATQCMEALEKTGFFGDGAYAKCTCGKVTQEANDDRQMDSEPDAMAAASQNGSDAEQEVESESDDGVDLEQDKVEFDDQAEPEQQGFKDEFERDANLAFSQMMREGELTADSGPTPISNDATPPARDAQSRDDHARPAGIPPEIIPGSRFVSAVGESVHSPPVDKPVSSLKRGGDGNDGGSSAKRSKSGPLASNTDFGLLHHGDESDSPVSEEE